ncbi:class I SAM-dependent methyltransferase [Glycomyces arizonensis]|uniref:class I SAM-dependent methyltransferase n=1 Tax=Glycomyces arizonensis TaxID=256035 RepID=UPI00041573AA|nr:class I SAM-dependent methyltransferase [Glycomyces arizonensis]
MSQESEPDTPGKEPRRIAAMFDRVAPAYDRTNTVMFAGQDRRWRKATREALSLQPGERCLDLGAGTGVSTAELARSGADVIGLDISIGMLKEHADRQVPLVAGDALHLPFADDTFNAVTGSYVIRNVVDVDACLAEILRVLQPGGRLVLCEVSHPSWKPYRAAHGLFVKRIMPKIAARVASDPEAYRYLAESTMNWPDQAAFADQIVKAGYRKVAWRNLAGGAVALHRGFK